MGNVSSPQRIEVLELQSYDQANTIDELGQRYLDHDLRLAIIENALKTIGVHKGAPVVIALPDEHDNPEPSAPLPGPLFRQDCMATAPTHPYTVGGMFTLYVN